MIPQTMTQGDEARTAERPLDVAQSIRSRRSILKEHDLREAIKRVGVAIAVTTRRIGELEPAIERTTKLVIHEGNSMVRYNLDEMLKDLAGQRDFLKACQNERSSIEAEIAKLAPGPVECKVRLAHQERVASLVGARFEKDREADRLIEELKRVLGERSELTSKMAEPCEALDLEIGADGLDETRFEKLLSSLPDELLTASERWQGWFLGKRNSVRSYVVRAEQLMVAETLVHNGVYHFGETICLNDQEASELLCEEYAAAEPRTPWRCAPPLVMTVEAYQAAVGTARKKGISPQEVCFWQDVERDARNKEWFKNNGSSRCKRGSPAVLKQSIPFAGIATITLLKDGAPMQVSTYKDAWSMVDVGAGPLP